MAGRVMDGSDDGITGRVVQAVTALALWISLSMQGQWAPLIGAVAGSAMALFPQTNDAPTKIKLHPIVRFVLSGAVGFFLSSLVELWWPGARVPSAFFSGLLGIPILDWARAQLAEVSITELLEKIVATLKGGK